MPRFYNKYKVRFSILTIRGDKREIREKEVNAPTPKAVKDYMKRSWGNSKVRVLKITKIGGPYNLS